MNTEDKIKIMQAYADGKKILCRAKLSSTWYPVSDEPSWDWGQLTYCIAPSPRRKVYVAEYRLPGVPTTFRSVSPDSMDDLTAVLTRVYPDCVITDTWAAEEVRDDGDSTL